MQLSDFCNPTLCSECKGKCCKQMSGGYYPQDIPMTIEGIIDFVNTNPVQFDCWEGDIDDLHEYSQIWYIRPQNTNSKDKLVDCSWGGRCIHLTENGCAIFSSRPTECRLLEPQPNMKCFAHGNGKYGLAKAWREYQPIVLDALVQLKRKHKQYS